MAPAGEESGAAGEAMVAQGPISNILIIIGTPFLYFTFDYITVQVYVCVDMHRFLLTLLIGFLME